MRAPVSDRRDRTFFIFNAVFSSAAVALIGFILMREGATSGGADLSFMPAVNAVCNALSAACLIAGYAAIRRRAIHVHRMCMVAAFTFSAVFLVGYLTYHYVHGDTVFTGTGAIRAIYFVVLITHIVLSITVVPGALTSFYFAYTRAYARHRRLNRVFFRSGCTVSVTGVLIFFLLRA